eukprot:TRINITY_DN25624_c0_g1_i1.p1 TRINITY_DN25624_c0_g1~~TRINITY_DN25624_c0_g1_i1.p1  ORF type:complete len:214 (-),score=48.39 TRINITY_DN25624_c0_g1_i1:210-851(-)
MTFFIVYVRLLVLFIVFFFFFQAEDGIRDAQESRGLGDVYKRQVLVDCFEAAYIFAHDFNRNPRARTKLWNRDMLESVPDLINQEMVALKGLLATLLRLYSHETAEEHSETAVECYLMRTAKGVLEQYVEKTIKPTLLPEESAEFHAFTPIVVQVLNGIAEFSDAQFKSQVEVLYLLLIDLMLCKHMDVRVALHRVMVRLGTNIFLEASPTDN